VRFVAGSVMERLLRFDLPLAEKRVTSWTVSNHDTDLGSPQGGVSLAFVGECLFTHLRQRRLRSRKRFIGKLNPLRAGTILSSNGGTEGMAQRAIGVGV